MEKCDVWHIGAQTPQNNLIILLCSICTARVLFDHSPIVFSKWENVLFGTLGSFWSMNAQTVYLPAQLEKNNGQYAQQNVTEYIKYLICFYEIYPVAKCSGQKIVVVLVCCLIIHI